MQGDPLEKIDKWEEAKIDETKANQEQVLKKRP